MNRRLAIFGAIIILGLVGAMATWLATHTGQLTLLQAHGPIALQERNLMGIALGLMLLVIVPVYVMIFSIAMRYRAGNTKAEYRPNWDSDRRFEAVWWGFPMLIIAILATLTWTSTHQLDPTKALVSSLKPLKVQVVALQYKWLFIYPDYNLASINLLELPSQQPISLQITADAPMNSFWIPALGGQIYAMPGMSTRLNLQADTAGDYRGSSANLSGSGFADMKFTAHVVNATDFDAWVTKVRAAGGGLDEATYNQLADHPATAVAHTYAVAAGGLYDEVLMKYMTPEVPE